MSGKPFSPSRNHAAACRRPTSMSVMKSAVRRATTSQLRHKDTGDDSLASLEEQAYKDKLDQAPRQPGLRHQAD